MPRGFPPHPERRAVPPARPAPFLRAVRFALLALALGGALLCLAPVEAQTATVLIKNTGQTSLVSLAPDTDYPRDAQAFTTGSHNDGYTLGSIGISFDVIADPSSAGSELTVTLNANSSGNPGAALCTLSDPATFTASSVNTFDAPATCPTLTAITTYFVVIERANNNTSAISYKTTVGGTEDSGGAMGWSIGNSTHSYERTSGTWQATVNQSILIEVRGSEAAAANNSASGMPTISGTPHVGEELTANTSAIMDADGTDSATFTYQWVRVDGMTETNIGTDSSTYTLTDDDEGTQIRVDVTFTDDADNAEGPLSSEVVGPVTVAPTVSLSLPTLTVAEGGSTTYTVALSVEPTAAVTVAISGGGGVTADPSSLMFTDTNWSTARQVTVTAAEDADALDDEIEITHSFASGSAPEYASRAAVALPVTVQDDEPAPTSIAPGTSPVVEGADATFTLTRNGRLSRALTVGVGVTETHSVLDGLPDTTVTFLAGEDTATLTVATDDDDVVEDDSEITVLVLADTNAPPTYVDGATASVSVTDNDAVVLAFSADQTAIAEADGGMATVTLAISNGKTFQWPQMIDVTISGTATAGADFTFVDAAGRTFTKPYTLTMPAGESAVTATITAVDDDRDDDGETIVLAAEYEGATVGTAQTITITDDDDAPALALSSLVIATSNSRTAYPAFDSDTLHYAVGCEPTGTLTVTPTAADSTARLSVQGTQRASGVPVTFNELDGDSDIEIVLSTAGGQSRIYTIHCVPDDYPTVTVDKQAGAWDGLILTAVNMGSRGDPDNRWTFLHVMDTNGVPRFHRKLDGVHAPHFRPQSGGFYPYGYLQTPGNELVLLDEHLSVVKEIPAVVWRSTPGLDDTFLDVHDFLNLGDGTSVFVIDNPITRDLSGIGFGSYGSAEQMEDEILIEVSHSGGVTVLWNSYDEMELWDCTQQYFTGNAYSHFNSIELLSDGHYLLSFRGCAQIVKIDSSTGETLWRVGRTNLSPAQWEANNRTPPYAIVDDPYGEFCGQHSAKLIGNGHLLLYDNGTNCLRDPQTGNTNRENGVVSRVVEYELDHDRREARFLRDHSLGGADVLTAFIGLVAPMDNGNWWISWGGNSDATAEAGVTQSMTEVNPETNQELLHMLYEDAGGRRRNVRSYPLRPDQISSLMDRGPLAAALPPSSTTSVFHTGTTDAPKVVVAFSRPVVDFDADTASVSVQGATVASVSPHLTAGEPANAYLFTLTPDGEGAITFSLVANQSCSAGGICAADGTVLTSVPAALVIGPPVTVSFGQAAYSVSEGSMLSVTVRLSAAHQGVRGVTVPVALDATSDADGDDDLTAGENVTFAAGETSKTLTVEALDDDLVEGEETATLEFGTLPHGVTAGSTAAATITVNDADQAQFTSTLAQQQVAEGGEAALTFTITNGVTFEDDQAVELTIGGNATPEDDFTLEDENGQTLQDPYEITFPSGDSSVSVTVQVVDDSDTEYAAETVTVSATLASTGASLGAAQTLTIPPSDVPDTPEVSIAAGSAVTEGEDATFTLTRTGSTSIPFTSPLTVSVEATDRGSALGAGPPTSARFEGGDVTTEVPVPTLDDRVVEPAGAVTLLIRGSTSNPPVYLTATVNAATVTVDDNDVAAFTLSASAEEVAEGSTVAVTIAADRVTFAEAQTLTLTLAGPATPGDDFTLAAHGEELSDPFTVTLPAGATSVAVTIQTASDGEDDVGETIELSASHDGNAVGTVTITIAAPPPAPRPVIFVGGGGGGGPGGPTPSEADFEWTVKRDIDELDAGHDSPTGSWSDGATLWLLENGDGADDAVYAYDLHTGERVEEREFELDEKNRAPRGVWSDKETIWVSDSGQNKLFACDLESGERLAERDIALAERNAAARGIWSDEVTMWVLDGRHDALFAYDLESGALLAEYALDGANDAPHDIWSDGVTLWVSNHDPKRLFAYRLEEGEDGQLKLVRNRDEEFGELSQASNNSPRGIWSDGEVMYVADESDDKVYSYNMPDAIDARLASLTLSGVDFGEFDRSRTDYEGSVAEGVTETVVTAEAMQRRTDVDINPPDADEAADGHQVALQDLDEITVTVTSGDGSREKVYRVSFPEVAWDPARDPWPHCLRGTISEGFSLVVFEGGSVEELATCAESRNAGALYALHEGVYVSYILGAPDFVNREFRELFPDGLPVMAPLVAGSDGPPSADPFGDDLEGQQPWPECLRGKIAEGFSLVVYEGGSVEQLVGCAEQRGVTALYALADGEWVSYTLGAPAFANQPFRVLFPDGIPPITPLVARSEEPPEAN